MVDVETDDANKTNPWLLVLLMLVLGLTLWTALQDKEGNALDGAPITLADASKRNKQTMQFDDAGVPKQRTGQAKRQNGLIDWDKLNRTKMDVPRNLFKTLNSQPSARAKKKRAMVQVAPPPMAPPVPFEYMGRLDNGPQGNLVYLATAENSYSIVVGNKVNSFWRLDKEDGNTLYFTYLPLNLPQTLSKTQNASMQPSSALPFSGDDF